MGIKSIRRATHVTCVVVESVGGSSTADTLPSKVRVTLQRPRGSCCLWLGKKSRQVAMFTFPEGPRQHNYTHAMLDLEKLFKYSNKVNTQVKICVQHRRGEKSVARIPLEEFLRQLLCTGRTDWAFLYIHREKVTLVPGNYEGYHNDVPEWAFEGTKSAPKEERGDEKHHYEETCVTGDETMNEKVSDIDDVQKEEDTTDECLTVTEVEQVSVTEDERAVFLVPLQRRELHLHAVTNHEVKNITFNDETISEKEKNEEETGTDWKNELESLSEENSEEQDYDSHIIENHEEEDNERMTDTTQPMMYDEIVEEISEKEKNEEETGTDWKNELESLSEETSAEEDYDNHITENHEETDNERLTDTTQPMMYDETDEEMADCSISLSRLLLSWHGAALVVCFVVLVAVFDDILQDGDWGWGWRIAFLVVSYFIMTIALLDFFQEEN